MSETDSIDVDRLLAGGFVTAAEYHPTLDSTQDRAAALAAAGQRGPLVVIADRQTAGRGRGGNRWWTGPGSLAFSLLVDPVVWNLPAGAVPLRSLAAGVAVVAAVSPALAPERVGLHWPNDVFVGPRKLAGILIDVLADGRHILGIGLNVNNSLADAPADVRARGTSLRDLTDRQHDRTALLAAILAELARLFRQSAAEPQAFGRQFQDLCLQVDRQLTVHSPSGSTQGRCRGIAVDGALLLETERGLERIYSGVLG